MNTNATSLDRLHDIIMPAPVPWWPPAPGWYWVLTFASVALVVVLFRGLIRWQQNRYRREALAELGRFEPKLNVPGQRAAALLALSELMKRTALTAFSREAVAALTGARWFDFLDQTATGANLSGGLGMMLENSVYDPRTADTLDDRKLQELTAAVRHWIRYHQTEIKRKETKAMKNRSDDKPLQPSFRSVQDSSVQKPC